MVEPIPEPLPPLPDLPPGPLLEDQIQLMRRVQRLLKRNIKMTQQDALALVNAGGDTVARKTFLPGLARVVNYACTYIQRHQATIYANLAGDSAAMDAVNAVETACRTLSKYLIRYIA